LSPLRRRSALVVAALSLATLGGCGGGGGASGDGQAATGGQRVTTTTAPRDKSPFCVAIRKLEALGSDQAPAAGTPAEVLAQNAKLAALIDQAAASTPSDAPADVQALIADYRVLSKAIDAAGGDTAAAFSALGTSDPALTARLGQADAHRASFVFFAERCGTAPPT
jgi:hypothetical protein